MEACSPEKRARFYDRLGTAKKAQRASVVPDRASKKDGHWDVWTQFCEDHSVDPFLSEVTDKLPFLEVFGAMLRSGEIAPRGNPIRSRSVEDYIRTVGEEIASMGANDPWLMATGQTLTNLTKLYKSYAKEDPPPEHVKPIPIQIIEHLLEMYQFTTDPMTQATINFTIIRFFFLLRPGEHTFSRPDNHLF